jgi:hypothetical protein
MTLRFWSRKGEPIDDTKEWAELYEDIAQRCVAFDGTEEGEPSVSTIWMGMSSDSFLQPDRPYRVFETAELDGQGHLVRFDRADTEEQALAMHAQYCQEVLGRDPQPEDGWVEQIIERNKRRG